jgi:transcriptional regulator with XRE-family HTH domain
MSENCIKEIRKRKHITQVELAQKLGISQGAIQELETGERGLDLDWIEKISKALNVKPWELLPKEMQPDISPDEMEIIRAVRKSKEVVAKTDEVSSTNKAS